MIIWNVFVILAINFAQLVGWVPMVYTWINGFSMELHNKKLNDGPNKQFLSVMH